MWSVTLITILSRKFLAKTVNYPHDGLKLMAWNPSPKVAAARGIGKLFGKPQVVVLMIDQDKGTFEFASYGETKALCAEAQKIGDVAFDAVIAHLSSNAPSGR